MIQIEVDKNTFILEIILFKLFYPVNIFGFCNSVVNKKKKKGCNTIIIIVFSVKKD